MYKITFNPCDECDYRVTLTGDDSQCKICEFASILKGTSMTIEKQKQYIKEEQNIIKGIRKRYKSLKDHDKLYIKDLEDKIEQREKWIQEQERLL